MNRQYTETVLAVNRHYTVLDIPPGQFCRDYTSMSFAANLKTLRAIKNWTQGDLAERVGVAQPTVQRWESEEREPRKSDRERLAAALGVSVGELFGQLPAHQAGPRTVSVHLPLPNEGALIDMFRQLLEQASDAADPDERAQMLALNFPTHFQAALLAQAPPGDETANIPAKRPRAGGEDRPAP